MEHKKTNTHLNGQAGVSLRLCRHPDREEQFGLVKPSIAEIGMVSVFITSLPVASFPRHIFSMVRSIIYECIRKRNRLIEHHVAFCS